MVIRQNFERRFTDLCEYMLWVREETRLEGNECIKLDHVAALAMTEYG
jgi:hypothetical protein